ncbi:MAG: GNAT family N-acetyltransferase [Hyphomonas sp.]
MSGVQPAVAPDGTTPSHAPSAYRVTSVVEVTDREALDALMSEYYGVIVGKLTAAGIPHGYTPDDLKASFWPNLHKFLPPAGRLILVHDAADRLVGCGTLQQIRPDAGELKRLYVRPEAMGQRLGRDIVDARLQAARDMGWTTLLVNAIRGNTDMTRIYESIGFRYIDRYPECADPIEVDPWFVYLQRDLT